MLYGIITNKALVIPICAWAVAQLIKTLVPLVRGKGLNLRNLFRSGGMPSAHSTLVTALATSVAMVESSSSVAFGVTAILALIVMYDAADVRQSVSRQAAALNRIIKELRLRRPVTDLGSDFRELFGHTPFQVVVGGALGIAVAWLWMKIAAM